MTWKRPRNACPIISDRMRWLDFGMLGHGTVIVPPKGQDTKIVIGGTGTFIQTQLQVSDIRPVGKEDPHCQTCRLYTQFSTQVRFDLA